MSDGNPIKGSSEAVTDRDIVIAQLKGMSSKNKKSSQSVQLGSWTNADAIKGNSKTGRAGL